MSKGGSKRLLDGDGLYLLLFADGGSHGWRFDYTFAGKRKTISFGTYPDTTLAIARRKADAARGLLAEGLNPSDAKKAQRAERKAEADAQERVEKGLPPVNSLRGSSTTTRPRVMRTAWPGGAWPTRRSSCSAWS